MYQDAIERACVEKLKREVEAIYEKVFRKFRIYKLETALNGYFKTFRIGGRPRYDPQSLMRVVKQDVVNLIGEQAKPLKLKLVLTCSFEKSHLL